MPFSELNYPRVRYGRTALQTVVCQLQFNPILRIGQETPVAVQDRLRQEFPLFAREERTGFRVGPGVVEALPAQPAVSRFQTEDRSWTVGLAVNNLSLETTAYRDFPDFERRLALAEEAFQAIYGTDHYTRVGLRYVNVFHESQFPDGWLDKFNPHVLGPLADPTLGGSIAEYTQGIVFAESDWFITMRHGLTGDQYIIDIDHYAEGRTEREGVMYRLRDFNRRVYQAFKWAISDRLHEMMEPGPHD